MSQQSSFEGLRRFLQHKNSLDPKNNPRGENGFAKEFQQLKELSSRQKKDKAYSTCHGEKDINRHKNRYKDILPYDYSRIILPEIEGVEGSDYINGNYIKSPTNEIAYLTAQGPLPKTVDDFWRMIISHKIQVIVMACREYELGKLKCKRYWPENTNEELSFAGMKITLVSQEAMGDGFVIRTLSATYGKTKHIVTQFHYTAWPDHDVPRSATPLIELTMSFRSFVGNNHVPVLVHCSAGCGRTGTICALDFAWTQLKTGQTDNFSVFDIVAALRKQRIAMVQTKEQYALVYKAVEELVRNELKKQRLSDHTYVNVTINAQSSDGTEQTYENVEFIRSIQRLHQEEKKATQKPLPDSNAASAPVRKKEKLPDRTEEYKKDQKTSLKTKLDIENIPQLSKPPVKSQDHGQSNQKLKNISAEKGGKPALAQRPPQEYVNVTIGDKSTDLKSSDNQAVSKSVKPAKQVKPATPAKPSVYSKQMSYPSTSLPAVGKPIQIKTSSVSDYEFPPSKSPETKESDYVFPPVKSGTGHEENPRHVPEDLLIDFDAPPVQSTSPTTRNVPSSYENVSVPRKVPEVAPQHKLIDLDDHQPHLAKEPKSVSSKPDFPKRRSSSDEVLQSSEGIKLKKAGLVVQNKTTTQAPESKVHNTAHKRGQYSLVGAIQAPHSPRGSTKSPFAAEDTSPFRKEPAKVGATSPTWSPFGFGGDVIADSEDSKVDVKPQAGQALFHSEKGSVFREAKPEKPVAALRRTSDVTKGQGAAASSRSGPPSARVASVGSYSLVTLPDNDKTTESKEVEPFVQTSTAPSVVNPYRPKEDMYSSIDKARSSPNLLFEGSPETSERRLVNGSFDPVRTSKQPLSKQRSVESDISNYGLMTAVRRKSEDMLRGEDKIHPLYSRTDDDDPVRHRTVGLRRSNSGGITPVQPYIPGDIDSMYATVAARPRDGKRRTALASDLWTPGKGHVPSSQPAPAERKTMHTEDSSSSLKSTTSSSSDDAQEELPPIPTKTAGAFLAPGEDEPYENVQTSSRPGTIDRFKAKAKNMVSGAQLSMSRRQVSSPAHTPRSGSPVEGSASLKDDLAGYGRRVGKPCGPRRHPTSWPDFPSLNFK